MKFGDMNDVNSEVRSLYTGNRKYTLLEEIGTKPNVFYHAKSETEKKRKTFK